MQLPFELDPQIIHHIIYSQAGSIGKAIIELLMNSVDARAAYVQLFTREPALERWDAEDEFAWYRVKEEGAVSIYNQGVLVLHDPGHTWGAGGLIVTKKAIALNVSRTEILRKTCPIWKSIAKQFDKWLKQRAANIAAFGSI